MNAGITNSPTGVLYGMRPNKPSCQESVNFNPQPTSNIIYPCKHISEARFFGVIIGAKSIILQWMDGLTLIQWLFNDVAVPSGNYNSGFNNAGTNANFWSATQNNANNAWRRNLNNSNAGVNRNNNNKNNGYSVRCVRD